LGFFTTTDLTPGKDKISNFALADHNKALKWVHDNIEEFGGDPDKVTVLGQSAGGASVCNALVSPLNDKLFRAGIPQSYPCTNTAQTPNITAYAEAGPKGLVKALDCSSAPDVPACMRSKPADAIIAAVASASLGFSASHGDKYLPVAPSVAFASGKWKRRPLLHGTTAQVSGKLVRWL
jgi:para-nitrobenzyl esterase